MPTTSSSSDQFPRKFGNYHLLGPLAQGGMGALYLAITGDRGFERLLCIKTVIPHLADKEYLARFRDEAKIVVQLSHGNLIPVFDAGQVEGELFLAMDFVKGKDLRAVWNRCAKKGVAFPVDVAVYLTKELCRGVGYAHQFGDIRLVHRDISPPNILISYAGEVKLTDFGLASSTLKMEKTVPGIIYGKVAYMSPEQARGEKLDGRSDIYAAGIVLWELLTGRQLFPPGEAQPQDLLKRAKNPGVQAPSKRAPRVPAELDAIVLRALTSKREDRYASADEFRDALGTWLATNHPSTDTSRVETFVQGLFDEDMQREENERLELIAQTRERIKTLPPSDELRRLLEVVGQEGLSSIEKVADRRQEEDGPNKGRRAPDQGLEQQDRRAGVLHSRRLVDVAGHTHLGVAVDVPKPGPRGGTVVSGGAGLDTAALARARNASMSGVIGQILDGRYLVEKLIGEGGMGRVYLAEHVDIGKQVAVKVLHPVYSRMPDLVERFRREARAASKIGHPNIVDVTDSGTTEDGSVYFVMEYLEGIELGNVLERETKVALKRSLDISVQVCRALSAAHAAGIIHRDLKPENIFLTPREGTTDFVKILDFGIAKSAEMEEAREKKLTSPGMAMGTPEYMAPEQAAGRPADQRCDIYSLGAILYEMLTGVAPYEGANFMEILTRKATEEPASPTSLEPSIPSDVNDLVMRAMARSPDERPPTMEAFEYELTKCISGRGAAVASVLGISQDDVFETSTQPGVTPFSSPPVAAKEPTLQAAKDIAGEAAEDGEGPTLEIESEVPIVSGGAFKTLGWVVFGALLVLAGAAVFYVASGESRAPRTRAANGKAIEPEEIPAAEGNKVSPIEPEGDPAIVYEDIGGEDAGEAMPFVVSTIVDAGVLSQDAGSGVDREKTQKSRSTTGPPRSDRDAERLLKEARSHLASLNYKEAQAIYKRVSSGRYRRKEGYLGLADVAFQTKQPDQAIGYAKKAGKSIRAYMVLGNAHFKKHNYQEALNLYSEVLKRQPGHEEAQKSAKSARQQLGL